MKICVTKGDIKRGLPMRSYGCPVHRALRRRTGVSVPVGHNTIRLENRIWCLPEKAMDFIQAFDYADNWHRRRLRPFSFNMIERDSFAAF